MNKKVNEIEESGRSLKKDAEKKRNKKKRKEVKKIIIVERSNLNDDQ